MKKYYSKIILGLSLLIFIVGLSCTKIDVPKGTPKWVRDKIKEDRNKISSVYQYNYQNKIVFLFNYGSCCDAPSYLYSENGNYICMPQGGDYAGGDGKCTDFYLVSTNKKIIWEDNQ